MKKDEQEKIHSFDAASTTYKLNNSVAMLQRTARYAMLAFSLAR
jgi:hypothetical protein